MITNLVVIAAQVVSGVVTNAPMLLPYNPAIVPPLPPARTAATPTPTEMWQVINVEKRETVRFDYAGRQNEIYIVTPITNITTHLKQEWKVVPVVK